MSGGEALEHGVMYALEVKALTEAGVYTRAESNGFLVDLTPPEPPPTGVSDGGWCTAPKCEAQGQAGTNANRPPPNTVREEEGSEPAPSPSDDDYQSADPRYEELSDEDLFYSEYGYYYYYAGDASSGGRLASRARRLEREDGEHSRRRLQFRPDREYDALITTACACTI
jgi:hypothetical protein